MIIEVFFINKVLSYKPFSDNTTGTYKFKCYNLNDKKLS